MRSVKIDETSGNIMTMGKKWLRRHSDKAALKINPKEKAQTRHAKTDAEKIVLF
jgi:hypothetical protein